MAPGEPLFTDNELRHMLDVKLVVRQLLLVWYAAVAVLVGASLWAWQMDRLSIMRRGLRRGGLLTLGIGGIVGIVATVGASGSGEIFWEFFSGFHGLFFAADTWLFSYSDTLIRLYPLRFWQDSLLYIGVLAVLGASALTFAFRERPSSEV